MAEITIRLKPFNVPNFVIAERSPRPRQDGISFDEGIPLAEIEAEVLASLCDDFRASVFSKAGKADPRAKLEHDKEAPDA